MEDKDVRISYSCPLQGVTPKEAASFINGGQVKCYKARHNCGIWYERQRTSRNNGGYITAGDGVYGKGLRFCKSWISKSGSESAARGITHTTQLTDLGFSKHGVLRFSFKLIAAGPILNTTGEFGIEPAPRCFK